MVELSQKQSKGARTAIIAAGLGVDIPSLMAARKSVIQAERGLDGLVRSARTSAVAARLGITASELKILRRGLGEPYPPELARVRSILRDRLSPASNRQVSPPSAVTRYYERSNPGLVPPSGISKQGQPDAYSVLFVMDWGNVVHRYYDCAGTRAFLTARETDRSVYRVEARDPCCRGRRVCRICEPDQGSGWAALVIRVLIGLHGPSMEDDEWERSGLRRPRPKGPPYFGSKSVRHVPTRRFNESGGSARSRSGRSATMTVAASAPTANPVRPGLGQPMRSDYAVGESLSWEGFNGVVADKSSESVVLAMDGGLRIRIPLPELHR